MDHGVRGHVLVLESDRQALHGGGGQRLPAAGSGLAGAAELLLLLVAAREARLQQPGCRLHCVQHGATGGLGRGLRASGTYSQQGTLGLPAQGGQTAFKRNLVKLCQLLSNMHVSGIKAWEAPRVNLCAAKGAAALSQLPECVPC